MEITNSQGSAAYANAPGTTPPVDNTLLQDQNRKASQADLNTDSTAAAQKAFEVNISPEARNRLSVQGTEEPAQTQAAAPEDQTNQTIAQAHEQSQIVNIVA